LEFKGNAVVEELSSHLQGESPRCTVIVAAAYFDENLAGLLGNKKDRSFAARINDALAWGLLTPNEHEDLHALRELRNGFAHDLRVRDFDATTGARVASLAIWRAASDARPLGRVIQKPLEQLLFVVGVIAFRLNKRIKPPEKTGPLPEPSILEWESWPPVSSV
jgi:Domain of unknown function (DUF4145)